MAAPRNNINHLKHGMRYTRIYNIWKGMRQRCSNPNCKNYNNYGGKGIQVCQEWNDFRNFYGWSMENGYTDELTIDRIDSNGNYEPSNCRWATYKEQNNNKTNSKLVEYNGELHTIGEWSSITGIKLSTIWERLRKGWSVESTLTTKPIVGRNQYGKV